MKKLFRQVKTRRFAVRNFEGDADGNLLARVMLQFPLKLMKTRDQDNFDFAAVRYFNLYSPLDNFETARDNKFHC